MGCVCDETPRSAERVLAIGCHGDRIARGIENHAVSRVRRQHSVRRRRQDAGPRRKTGRRSERRARRCRKAVTANGAHRRRVGVAVGVLGLDLDVGQRVAVRVRTRRELLCFLCVQRDSGVLFLVEVADQRRELRGELDRHRLGVGVGAVGRRDRQ